MSWQLIISAFSLGLLSSFHCVGMCGAIAFSLPTQHLAGPKKIAGILLYNGGRIFMYSLIGILFGLVGRQIRIAGFQQWFSIIAGVIILLIVIQTATRKTIVHLPGFKGFNAFTQKLLVRWMKGTTVQSMFLLGMANGLLPCGLVYLAVTGSLAAGTIGGAAGFMAAFGLGTFPALFLLSYFGFMINISTRNAMRKAVPYVITCMAVLLILRGMNLNIPYVSPYFAAQSQVSECH
jgi:uncharacterized protein